MRTAVAVRRDWSDTYRVGPVRLDVRAAGCLVGWRVRGPGRRLTPAERERLAALVREKLFPHRTHDAVYAMLFPPLPGGLGRFTDQSGAVYADRE